MGSPWRAGAEGFTKLKRKASPNQRELRVHCKNLFQKPPATKTHKNFSAIFRKKKKKFEVKV
jgi:hypothetical protein